MIYLAAVLYAAILVGANLLVLAFGPVVAPVNAFFLIGLDLALRNWLNLRMRPVAMAALILGTGLLTYFLNPAARSIAVASAVAFTCAALADWLVFNAVTGTWMRKSLAGNTVGAAVDSLIFPTLAFGALLPFIVLAQFVAKVAGGAMWAYLLSPSRRWGRSRTPPVRSADGARAP
jgi:uncharacterized PurR-regulated membrane protein YhhQ (DUF165 family)